MHINNAAIDRAVILHQQDPKMAWMTFTAEEESMRENNLLVFQGLVYLMATRKGSLWEGRSLSMSKQPLAESLIPENGGPLRPQRTYRQNPIHLRQRREIPRIVELRLVVEIVVKERKRLIKG
jgi:hypothetical protein